MTDYISRDAIIKWVEKTYCKPCEKEKRDYNHCRCGACQYDDMILDISSFPAADVRPVVRGEWKLVGSVFPMYECDQCHAISLGGNFCPNCGADMRKEIENVSAD